MTSEAIYEGIDSMSTPIKIASFLENMVWATGSVGGDVSWRTWSVASMDAAAPKMERI